MVVCLGIPCRTLVERSWLSHGRNLRRLVDHRPRAATHPEDRNATHHGDKYEHRWIPRCPLAPTRRQETMEPHGRLFGIRERALLLPRPQNRTTRANPRLVRSRPPKSSAALKMGAAVRRTVTGGQTVTGIARVARSPILGRLRNPGFHARRGSWHRQFEYRASSYSSRPKFTTPHGVPLRRLSGVAMEKQLCIAATLASL